MIRREKFKIMNEEEMLTFVSCFLAKLSDNERESVIKYGGECYRDGYVDGYKTMFKAGLAGIILGHVAWGVIQNKLEAKRDVKFYSFENIKKKSEEENN